MEFEWDEAKQDINLRKHGIAFEDAIELFDDPHQFTQAGKPVEGELRFKTTGKADAYAVLTVVHTLREIGNQSVVRIISARPASRRERRTYDK